MAASHPPHVDHLISNNNNSQRVNNREFACCLDGNIYYVYKIILGPHENNVCCNVFACILSFWMLDGFFRCSEACFERYRYAFNQ